MIYVIVGPTGVGKTAMSVALAHQLNAEIVNADSMQVYRTFDIATAKIKEEEKVGIPHHLFDIKDPWEDYSVYDYQKDARRVIAEIFAKGKNVILVGGTGFYIKAALYDFDFQEETTSCDYSAYTTEELYQKALSIDPSCSIHPNNRRRLERFLEKAKQNSFPARPPRPLYDFRVIGLTTDRAQLYNKIEKRVDQMVEEGLLKEAKKIYDSHIRSKAVLTAIGYKELFPYFDGKCSLEEALDAIKRNSKRYAKRQYTYFRHQLPVIWFLVDYEDFSKTIQEVLSFLSN